MAAQHTAVVLTLLTCSLASAARLRDVCLPCLVPQPRSLESRQLMETFPDELVYPPYAILHRCDDAAGCCLGILQCSPLSQEEVLLVFAVVSVFQHGPWMEEYRAVTATNHTACGCVDPTDQWYPR